MAALWDRVPYLVGRSNTAYATLIRFSARSSRI